MKLVRKRKAILERLLFEARVFDFSGDAAEFRERLYAALKMYTGGEGRAGMDGDLEIAPRGESTGVGEVL